MIMNGEAMIDRLKEWAAQRGYRIAWGPGSIVEDVQREIVKRRSGFEIDELLFEHELKSLLGKESHDSGRSVVLIAKPRPAHSVCFDLEGKYFDALMPPTYFRYRATFEEVRQDLAQNGLPGVSIEYLTAPFKATASRLGLVRYGRNNISYADGLGSYLQLCGYWVNVHLPEMQETVPASLLPQCEDCGICMSICPTGAISEDRVLIRAEQCLTFINENPGDWPDWLSPKAHNCLLGCLECQKACPANPELPIEATGLSFSGAETRLLLSDGPASDDRAETGIRMKLAWLGQPYVESILGRNLAALTQSKLSAP
jgi:epoxyqueuosine reductase